MTRILLLALLVFPVTARGGLSAPNSSVTVSPDGRKVLVMVSPEAKYDQKPTAELPDGRVVDVRQTFAKSGVYDVSTLAPVWQVDWFALNWDLLISDDFRHVVRRDRRGMHTGRALAFYEDGRLVRTYTCGQLLTGMRGERWLPYSTWDWHTQWCEDFELGADRQKVVVSTARRRAYLWGHRIDLGLQEFYAFDLTDGSVVSRRVEGRWRVWAYAAGLAAVCVVAVVAARAGWRRIRRLDRRRGFAVMGVDGGTEGDFGA